MIVGGTMAKARELAPGIEMDPGVCSGKPVVKNTRVPVEVVLEQLSLGATVDEVADEYGLTREAVLAVLGYARGVVASVASPRA
jgi:uncharacterized protein (DUF433 family)